MGEPAAAEAGTAEPAAAGAVTSERDVLLATKLNVPGLRLLGPPPPPSLEPLVTALISEVVGQPDADGALLVLDDYHVISSPLVHESLGFLLEHRPAGLPLACPQGYVPLGCLARLQRALAAPGVAPDAGRASVTPAPGLVDQLTSRELEVLEMLAAGRSNQAATSWAARWADETGLHAGDEPRYPREPEYLVLARVLLTQQRPAEALALLDRVYAAAAAQDRVGSMIEAGALRALALAANGDADRAVDALAGALTLACPQGYVRVFADEGPPMAALLARLIAAQRAGSGFQAAASVPLGYLARLRSAFGAEPAAPHTAAVPGLIDPLTSRELEVLQMLAAGKSNRAIALELVVTLDTVKKHVSHLLGKLGAANRTEAVTRARELGLTP